MKLEYIDHRPFIFYLKTGQTLNLPNKNIKNIEVSEKEGKRLLKYKNGNKPMFRVVAQAKKKKDDIQETVNISKED